MNGVRRIMANHELTEESITHKGYEDNLRLW